MKTAWERNEFCRGEILERCYEFMFLCVQNKVCIVFTVSMVSFCVWKLHVLNWLCPMSTLVNVKAPEVTTTTWSWLSSALESA